MVSPPTTAFEAEQRDAGTQLPASACVRGALAGGARICCRSRCGDRCRRRTLALDQSKSTTPHPAVEAVEVKPLLLHGMMIVDEFI